VVESPDYVVRANALETERRWQLHDGALRWDSAHGPQQFAFDKITAIRLEYAPTRANAAQYLCHVSIATGWTETIASTHYAGVMSFEDRAADYRRFVTALIERVVAANPCCAIRCGASATQYLGNSALLLVSLMLVGFLLLVIGMPLTVIGVAMLTITATYVPSLLRWFKSNRPLAVGVRGFDISQLEPHLPPQP
jgi:hypothetical protein